MTEIGGLFTITAVDTRPPFNLPGKLEVFVSLLPPGVGLALSLPPLTVVLDATEAAALAAALLAAVEGL